MNRESSCPGPGREAGPAGRKNIINILPSLLIIVPDTSLVHALEEAALIIIILFSKDTPVDERCLA